MKKILLISFMLLSALVMETSAQERSITGKVTSEIDGSGLPGVNVILKGTTDGTTTDIDGNYKLSVPSSGGAVVFSFIGMTTQEIEIGSRSVIDITMVEDATQLAEVVVTAFGVERERKELGYSVTTVDGEDLSQARSSNVLQSLSGRVAGVRVNSSSGTAGGGVNIQIRGAKSIAGNGSPLFVVDGSPILNSSFNGTRNEIIGGGADVGNRAADINPDDVATLTVLKGGSATALYGQLGMNGVILITTKKGKSKDVQLDINSSVRFSSPLRLPDFQNEYASGDFGAYETDNFTNGWGPKISESSGSFKQFPYLDADGRFTSVDADAVGRPLRAFPNNVADFFETGATYINNVALSQSTESGDYRISFTNHKEEGIVPENTVEKNTFSFNAGTALSKKLSARASVNYVRTVGLNRPRQGSNNPSRVISQIYNTPRTLDVNILRENIVDVDGTVIGSDGNQTSNNPYWGLQNNPFNNEVDRMYGNFQLNYRPLDWLDFMARVSNDFYRETRSNILAKGTKGRINGEFENRNLYQRLTNLTFIGTVTKRINEDFNFSGNVGLNVFSNRDERQRLLASDLGVSGLYNPANALSTNNQQFLRSRRRWGVFTNLNIDYKDYLFLTLSGRRDKDSSLPKGSNSYFYPGADLSFTLSEAFTLPEFISYSKFRASWAKVGNVELPGTIADQINFLFDPVADIFTQFVSDNTFPHGGQLGFEGPDLLPAGQGLRPQDQTSIEVGTELQFFKSRLGLDFAYYHITTEDQVVSVDVAQSTGFDAVRRNAGTVENKGIELLLFGKPISTPNFEWEVALNYTRNRQTVSDLPAGLEELALTSGFSGLHIRASPGDAFGLWGAGWDRSPDGDIIINSGTGLRERGGRTRLGDINPDWQGGITNTFRFKGITLNTLIDISQGGVMWSGTVTNLRAAGLVEETVANRGETFVDIGVNEIDNGDGTFSYVPNTTPVDSMQDYWDTLGDGSNTEGGIFGADYIKLREVTVSYQLPASVIENLPFRSLSVGIEGRNLWLISSEVPHIDPEASFFGPSLIGGQANVEFYSVPTAKSIGFNLKIGF